GAQQTTVTGSWQPVGLDLVAEARLEVVGAVDHGSLSRQAPERSGRGRTVGDDTSPAGRILAGGHPACLLGELWRGAARQLVGHSPYARGGIGQQPVRAARGRDRMQLDPRDRAKGLVGLARPKWDI